MRAPSYGHTVTLDSGLLTNTGVVMKEEQKTVEPMQTLVHYYDVNDPLYVPEDLDWERLSWQEA